MPEGRGELQLVTGPTRITTCSTAARTATDWEDLDLDTAMDMIADRVVETRRQTWQDADAGAA